MVLMYLGNGYFSRQISSLEESLNNTTMGMHVFLYRGSLVSGTVGRNTLNFSGLLVKKASNRLIILAFVGLDTGCRCSEDNKYHH